MEYIVKYTGDILSLGYPTELLGHQYAILELTPEEVPELLEYRQIEYFEPSEGLSPLLFSGLDSACITPVKRDEALGLTGSGIMIGFIDSGIDLTHPEFLTEDGETRVLWLWDMTIPGNPPLGFRKGTVYSSAEIDQGMALSRDTIGHGTAAAAIAAGSSGIAPEAAIVAVKMGSGSSATSTDVMRGIKFILDCAAEGGMPCVINLSYGTNKGSHQGQSLFETYMDAMAQQGRTVIVCASGNEGDSGHHFYGKLASGGVLDVEFTVSTPREDIYLTLWKSFADTARFPMAIGGYRSSTGTASPFSGRGALPCQGHALLDLCAPAEQVYTARAGGGYDTYTGTSMAAPFVSGSAALLMEWGIIQGNDPFLYGQRVKAFLCANAARSTFLTYPDPVWGYGKLNLCAALADLVRQRERGTL